jgi:NAD(P)-dependent dehydrogenase (short-subunit alcohol dehydrogenase family)
MSGCSPPFAVATGLIIGASRGIGVETVKAALEAGHSVRALSRSVRRIPVAHPKLEKMAGDALEMATVKRALTGSRCRHPGARRFGRARNHPHADAVFLAGRRTLRNGTLWNVEQLPLVSRLGPT